MSELVLSNARLPDGRIADISIDQGIITHIGSSGHGERVINCRNRLCIPAATDMHVHMRDGSQAAKETWKTGTQAAAAGGVATVVDQPNTIPPMDTVENFLERAALASKESFCHFGINGSVTEHADIAGLAKAGVLAFGEMFAAPSSYGSALPAEVIRDSLKTIANQNMLVTVHAEEVILGEIHSLAEHSRSRPISGEIETIRLVQNLAPTHAQLHICHVSGAEAFETIKGSFEVAPHHLFLSYEDTDPENTFWKMNPPLRSKKERLHLIQNFAKIPVIASDHAPHTIQEKSQPFSASAPSGVPGVETMLPLLMNAVTQRTITLNDVIEKTVTNPCRILGISAPSLSPGSRADLAVYVDIPTKITGEALHSKCGWTPYEGMSGLFPATTVIGGIPAWHDGEFTHGGGQMWKNTQKAQLRRKE
ncbi:dihydroorotase, multifunctional complex type [Methanocorpusculum labreanum Z]|uniref:Dihydroorotase, multifunctional complex type n=1 Tax=Methanocorpusculum labreanum (strain ATCC 43576 / DSM 4855 / Z) TaxID=410358 RepID=A2SQD3_METLZ|nr:dihydroorotase [Methanocorpusculum labreanum]ABN06539.1 dihydroorotase, multifunctional complex type [Methanocorpusculum labreanum Z]